MQHERAVALGECGLDFARNASPRDVQLQVFERQCQLAAQYAWPLVVHSRAAADETFDVLQQTLAPTHKIHLHCFADNVSVARRFVEHFENLFIGFTGSLTFADAKRLREVAVDIPLDRILIETDAPYLKPRLNDADSVAEQRKKKKKRKSPSTPNDVKAVAIKIAHLRNLALPDVCSQLRVNVRAMYGI